MNNVTPIASKRDVVARQGASTQVISRIHLVGRMRVLGPGGENILPARKNTQAVFAYLCLSQGERLLRSRVAGLIWDRSEERQARDNLRHALNEVDRIGTWRLETDRHRLRLDTSSCWIDAFEAPDRSDPLLDGLEGISPSFDHWLVGERVRFENRWQQRLEQDLNDLVTKNAPPEQRAAAARKLLNFVPAHDPAVRSLMTAFVDMGDRALAIREYERFRVVLEDSLSMRPSERTVALYEDVRRRPQLKDTPSPAITDRDAAAPLPRAINGGAAEAAATLGRDSQPSIAVLPFRTLSAVKGHDHIAEGLTEDLVEALSRVPSLFVISRLSAALFRKQDRPPREIGEALGVRYIVSGSLRATGDRLRLVVELTDANTGLALWTARFDDRFSDLLEVQNRLAERVVRSLTPHLRSAEVNRVRIKRTEHHDAYDLFLRGQENMHNPTRAIFEKAGPLFGLAIERDPQYAAALAWKAYWHVMRIGQGWSPDPAGDTIEADQFAARAVECGATEPMAFAVHGHVAAYLHKDFAAAFARFEAALRLNPSSARAWLWNAAADAWTGDGVAAVEKINRAMALSPYDPLACAYSGIASMAYLADAQYDRAIEYALRCMRDNRSYTTAHKVLILASVLAGRDAEAQAAVHQLLVLEPDFTVEQFRHRSPVSAGPYGELYCASFAQAGVPLSN